MTHIEHIGVGITGDAHSLYTAQYAVYLARLLHARLTFIHVINERVLADLLKSRVFVDVEARNCQDEMMTDGRRVLDRFRKMAEGKKVICRDILVKGSVHTCMVNAVRDHKIDLMVIGELREPESRMDIFYDEGERILREIPCPVLMVKDVVRVERLYHSIVD